ncbi:MAG: protein kinase [Pirellulales bacterium]
MRNQLPLKHTNIAFCYETGKSPFGFSYAVYEYVDGQSIEEFSKKQITIEACISIVRDVALALEYAHELKIYHNDITPRNVLYNDRLTKIIDFGLASKSGECSPNHDAGTQSFMAPKPIDLSNTHDAYKDIYGTGALLYYLLTNCPPISLEGSDWEERRNRINNTTRLGMDEQLDRAGRFDEMARLRKCKPLHYRRILSGDLGHIVTKSLKKAGTDKSYRSISEFVRDLEAYSRRDAVPAHPKEDKLYWAKHWLKRRTIGVATAVLILGLLILSAILYDNFLQAKRVLTARGTVIDAYQEILGMLRKQTFGVGIQADHRDRALFEQQANVVSSLLKKSQDDLPIADVRSVRLNLASMYVILGRYSEAINLFEKALDVDSETAITSTNSEAGDFVGYCNDYVRDYWLPMFLKMKLPKIKPKLPLIKF